MGDMATRHPRLKGYRADGDLSAKQYHFVKAGTKPGSVAPVTAVTDVVLGIVYDYKVDGLDGDTVDVALPGGGGFLAMAGVVASGVEIKTDATGKGVAATAGDRVGAIAEVLDGSTASGDVAAVEVTHPYPRAT